MGLGAGVSAGGLFDVTICEFVGGVGVVVLMVLMTMLSVLFCIGGFAQRRRDEFPALRCTPSYPEPPEPADFLPGELAIAFAQFQAKLRAAFVLFLPELGAVIVPVFSELGRK